MDNDWTSNVDTILQPRGSRGGKLESAARKVAIPAARAGEFAASSALGGTIPSAAVGAVNLASTLATGEPLLPSYEEIYERFVPSLRTIGKGATHLAREITGQRQFGQIEKALGKEETFPFPHELLEKLPDIGPLAPPEKFRKEISKPLAGSLVEPGTRFEEFLSDYSSFIPMFTNPANWTSIGSASKDLAKAGAKVLGLGGAGEAGGYLGGSAGKALAEFGTLTALGAWNKRGTVDRVMNQKYRGWQDFVNNAGDSQVPVQGMKRELDALSKTAASGLGTLAPAKEKVKPIIESLKSKLTKKGKSILELPVKELDEIRSDLNDVYKTIGSEKKARHYLDSLSGLVKKPLEKWADAQGVAGKGAWEGLDEANKIFQGRLLTSRYADLAEKFLQQGKLPYAGALFAITEPRRAWQMFNTSPIRNIWQDVWWNAVKENKKGLETALTKFDKAIGQEFPSILSDNRRRAQSNVIGDWEVN